MLVLHRILWDTMKRTRTLKVTDDVHEMLTLLRPHPSASYDDVIRELIDDVCPYLQAAIDNLRLLEKENPRKAAGERLLLQKEIFEDVIVTRMLRQREKTDECQIDKHLDSLRTDDEIKKDNELKALNQRRRQLLQERLLREKEGTEKHDS
jgi:hypothetical protein